MVALGGAFLLGVLVGFAGGAPQTVHLGAGLAYHPASQPWLHGLYFAVNVALIEGALVLGTLVVAVLVRTGLLIAAAAAGMTLAARGLA